ncbi:hypothetical protein DTL21_26845 [Bremerella cremea]|uniref:Polymerase nucleotidyl transferase domain-containing protein n=1 Tax=Blastopirellula marina TaxID=124 RepID=A0A2S8FBZ8_9BACT|nr:MULTISPECIES: hypothetical protein [Pirellulaceae]PQO29662.1 hypothetical protein C5Y83_26800 [Blastopirellula marina]RCS42964.1 hypothetical protein DTL21_26845 [Bremerella cremea]
MYRDKDYLLTSEGLIFNVLGDQHPSGHVTAGLKYAEGNKWLDTYAAAMAYLQKSFPGFVTDRIAVPVDKIEQHLKPLKRTRQLLADRENQPPLLAQAIDLIEILAEHCEVPSSEIGLTDSLLWGAGNENSDIDLVIYGQTVITQFLKKEEELFQFDDIKRIDPIHIQRPPDIDDHTFHTIAERKFNQGTYQGTRFTIRGVLTDEEILFETERTAPFQATEPMTMQWQMKITNRDESLLYPISFDTEEGVPLVTYHIGYEMGFKPGDQVKATGTMETSGDMRRLLVGSIGGEQESIQIIS